MNPKFYILFLVVMNFFFRGDVSAQGTDSTVLPEEWTLSQAINYASQHNIQINSLRLTSSLDNQDLLLAEAAKAPNLSGTFAPTINNSTGATGVGNQSDITTNYSVNSSVVLYNGGYLRNDIKQKRLSLSASNLDVAAAQNNITIQVTQAYLNILLAKENVIYLKDIFETSQSQLKRGQIEYNAGSIAQKDLLQLQAQASTDKYNLVAGQNAIRQNTLTLKQVLQLPSSYDLKVVQPDTVIIPTSQPTELDSAENAALQQRPEVKSSELNVQVAQLNLLKSRAGSSPELTADGALGTGYTDINTGPYVRQLDNNFYQRIGLNLAIPIFNNRIVKTNIESSKIAISQANLDLDNTKTILSQEVEQAFINVENSQSQYDAAVERFNANQENYRVATQELNLGALATVDYLLQKNLYIQAVQEYVQSKYNSVLTRSIYQFYMGEPITL